MTEATAADSGDGNSFSARLFEGEKFLSEEDVYVSLTYDELDAKAMMDRVKSPKAGAVVLFAGCTRDSFAGETVTHLAYSSYPPLALRTLQKIARSIREKHELVAIAITHRLGKVDIGEESILIAVSSAHRQAAWKAGEECLEEVKEKVEVWKEEWFADGGVWRANRDGQAGVRV
ncbi:Molybdopterin synthase catalytic subunit [Cladosporium halotolerans]|uniref:Molybdopterin synthase catalytic subunit n=1 Tax=Cladosporium halotolerans TaxID=1052096 RepID=A0AB34KGU9_9PEZI